MTADQHKSMADAIDGLAEQAVNVREHLLTHYPKSTEPPRRAKAITDAVEELRRVLAGKFFAEGCSTDGRTPYFKPKAAEQEGRDDVGE
jgi:hypothetical protein